TGTAVGDPIEFAALTAAFASDRRAACWLGSIKPNIGHLDTGAGVASLIKVVQALRHEYKPPLANFTAPSELLDLANSPFVVSGQGEPWTDQSPRRAGISSLGVGGTNAHGRRSCRGYGTPCGVPLPRWWFAIRRHGKPTRSAVHHLPRDAPRGRRSRAPLRGYRSRRVAVTVGRSRRATRSGGVAGCRVR